MTRDPYTDLFDDLVPPAVSVDRARDRLAELTPVFERARRRNRIKVGLVSGLGLAGVVVAGAMVVSALSEPAPSRAVVSSESGSGLANPSGVDAGADDGDVSGAGSPRSDGEADVPTHIDPVDDSGPVDVDDDSDDVSAGAPAGSVESEDDTEGEGEPAPEEPTDGSESLEVVRTPGGSVTVDVVDGALVLVSSDPAPGFVSSVESQSALEIEVKLSDGASEYLVKFELQSDGSIETNVEPESGSESDSESDSESESEHEGEGESSEDGAESSPEVDD